jgi:hypothetical protein
MKITGVAAVIITAFLLGGCCSVFNRCPEPKHDTPVDVAAALKEIKWQILKSEIAVGYARETFRNYSGGRLAERKDTLEHLYKGAALNGNRYLSTVRESFGAPVLKKSDVMPSAEAVVDSVQVLYDFAHNDEGSAGKAGKHASSAITGRLASESLAEAGVVIYKANMELLSGYFNKMYENLSHLSWKAYPDL